MINSWGKKDTFKLLRGQQTLLLFSSLPKEGAEETHQLQAVSRKQPRVCGRRLGEACYAGDTEIKNQEEPPLFRHADGRKLGEQEGNAFVDGAGVRQASCTLSSIGLFKGNVHV